MSDKPGFCVFCFAPMEVKREDYDGSVLVKNIAVFYCTKCDHSYLPTTSEQYIDLKIKDEKIKQIESERDQLREKLRVAVDACEAANKYFTGLKLPSSAVSYSDSRKHGELAEQKITEALAKIGDVG